MTFAQLWAVHCTFSDSNAAGNFIALETASSAACSNTIPTVRLQEHAGQAKF